MDNNSLNSSSSGSNPFGADPNAFGAEPNFFAGSPAPEPVMAPGTPSAPVPQPPMGAAPKKSLFSSMSTIQLVIFIIISLVAATFIGLFIWMLVMWLNVKSDVDGQINSAVDAAVSATETRLAAEYEEQQKYPYNTFTGPSDLGSLSFEFPKTWSVYVASDGTNGNYEAYFNPGLVSPISYSSINAIHLSILNQSINTVTMSYDNLIKQGSLTVETRAIGGQTANIYTGAVTNNIQGIAAVFKIRDKTAIIQTDAMVFQEDFLHVLDTVKYNS